jgi:hypothetical protein
MSDRRIFAASRIIVLGVEYESVPIEFYVVQVFLPSGVHLIHETEIGMDSAVQITGHEGVRLARTFEI